MQHWIVAVTANGQSQRQAKEEAADRIVSPSGVGKVGGFDSINYHFDIDSTSTPDTASQAAGRPGPVETCLAARETLHWDIKQEYIAHLKRIQWSCAIQGP